MAEVQKSTHSGEQVARFIELVMMQGQQARFFLGLVPHPQTGKAEVNLELAKKFIGILEMLEVKTEGNLNEEEKTILTNTLTQLQEAFAKASGR